MSDFRWHIYADEQPEEGPCNYLLLGHKGRLRLAYGYEKGLLDYWGPRFNEYKSGYCTISAEKVKAWAKIPSLNDPTGDDMCAYIPDDIQSDGYSTWSDEWHCSRCGGRMRGDFDTGWFDEHDMTPLFKFCPHCGRKVL